MLLVDLPLVEYRESLTIQRRILENKIAYGAPDVLLILEHPPTVTLGVRGKHSDLLVSEECLRAGGISLHASDRGGEATYHGPGQVVCYPIVDLRSLGISVRDYVGKLEETVISALRECGVDSFRRKGKVGVWTGPNEKIASIGIKISRRIAFHGFSVNVDLQKDPSEFIVSCGMPEARMISINELVHQEISMKQAREAIARCFAAEFQVNLEPCSPERVIR